MSLDRRSTLRRLLAGGALLTLWPRAAFAKDPVVYTYDALGRLTSAAYPNGITITYTYDAAGNRTQVVAGSTPPPPPPPPPPLSVSVTPTSLSGTGSAGTDPATATANGGTAPYTYAWQRLSGSTSIAAADPTAATTEFVWTALPSGPPKLSTWRCRVTDAASAVADSNVIQVSIDPSA